MSLTKNVDSNGNAALSVFNYWFVGFIANSVLLLAVFLLLVAVNDLSPLTGFGPFYPIMKLPLTAFLLLDAALVFPMGIMVAEFSVLGNKLRQEIQYNIDRDGYAGFGFPED